MNAFLALGLALLVTLAACTPASTFGAWPPPHEPATLLLEEADVSATTPPVTLQRAVWLRPYAVHGDSPAAVRAGLDAHGPYLDGDRRRYDALTRWSLELPIRRKVIGDKCQLLSATIDLKAMLELPELAEPAGLSAQQRERWSSYRDALEQHELGHVERHRQIAGQLRDALVTLAPAVSCALLQRQVEELTEGAILAMRAADQEYDAATQHGARQGAVFP